MPGKNGGAPAHLKKYQWPKGQKGPGDGIRSKKRHDLMLWLDKVLTEEVVHVVDGEELEMTRAEVLARTLVSLASGPYDPKLILLHKAAIDHLLARIAPVEGEGNVPKIIIQSNATMLAQAVVARADELGGRVPVQEVVGMIRRIPLGLDDKNGR